MEKTIQELNTSKWQAWLCKQGEMITFITRGKNSYYHNLTETLQRTEKEEMPNS